MDTAVDEVDQHSEIGECKKDDLTALRVFKFRGSGQWYLLAYTLEESVRLVYLEAVGHPMKTPTEIRSVNQ